ncbi:PREDICTED: uncharacterized protein LOC106816310 [Priapulus caudatus]|uniref:Uncharacterized protein LOC106816310 n=1 Tax=Priapulus caudatus TaxID=37621 RepID=A0ABM1EW04_PRICU|nr:PREDICTED: uncharacterized protein LOC106816310 [Priapulus caudatus]
MSICGLDGHARNEMKSCLTIGEEGMYATLKEDLTSTAINTCLHNLCPEALDRMYKMINTSEKWKMFAHFLINCDQVDIDVLAAKPADERAAEIMKVYASPHYQESNNLHSHTQRVIDVLRCIEHWDILRFMLPHFKELISQLYNGKRCCKSVQCSDSHVLSPIDGLQDPKAHVRKYLQKFESPRVLVLHTLEAPPGDVEGLVRQIRTWWPRAKAVSLGELEPAQSVRCIECVKRFYAELFHEVDRVLLLITPRCGETFDAGRPLENPITIDDVAKYIYDLMQVRHRLWCAA